MSYDLAGNLTTDTFTGEGIRTYDAGNRMTQAWANSQWQTYTYDGDGHRVRRNVNGTETWQVYGIGGELLAEYAANAGPSTPQKEYGYRNGQLLVTAESSANIHWLIPDQLGTPRMVADLSGSLSGISRHDYLPFGEELYAGVGGRTTGLGYTGDNVREKFTEKERDSETGLDYFGARYYVSMQGRFTSPDPLLSSGRIPQPQSWNRYSYVLNRPLNLVDPIGLDWGQWDDDNGKRYYHWFYGKIGKYHGHNYTAVPELRRGGSSLLIPGDNGELVRIRNSGIAREVVGRWAAAPVAIQGQGNLNLSAGLFDGGVPFGKELREWALSEETVVLTPIHRNTENRPSSAHLLSSSRAYLMVKAR
jgi:RHS repeat-associated protein